MSQPISDYNMLFGMLALQMDFVSRDALVTAMRAWVLDKRKPLGQILLEQGALDADNRAWLEAGVERHLARHGQDPQQSLAALNPPGPVQEELRQIADADVQASLAHVGVTPRGNNLESTDPYIVRRADVGCELAGDGNDLESNGAHIGPRTLPPHARFRILRPHARGGLGEVFVARDQELKREVALKEIREGQAAQPESRARFLLEAEVTGALEHPGIVPVYGLGAYTDGRPFYAMRFVQGDSLKDTIRAFHEADRRGRTDSERSLALRQLLRRFVDVCNAIAYAHSRGVLHRDLKPANIMLGKYGETLVVDWGLAKVLDRAAGEDTDGPLRPTLGGDPAVTQTGAALGTPAYMSPEQAAGKLNELGPASDVYSLGATLYCLLTGRVPFAEGEVGEILARVQRGDFPPPRRVNGRVPRALEAVCLKAMALKPGDRYATPRDLADDVEHWLADEPVRAYREAWTARVGRWVRRHQTLTVGVILVLLAGVIVLSTIAQLGRARTAAAIANAQREDDVGRDFVRSFATRLDTLGTSKDLWSAEKTEKGLVEMVLGLANEAMNADARQYAALLPLVKLQPEAERLQAQSELGKITEKDEDSTKDRLTLRQANAAVTLLHLGKPAPVWPLLVHGPDPSRRTYLIHHLGPYDIPATVVLDRLHDEPEVSARRALLCALGEYRTEQVPAGQLQQLVARLVQNYQDDPDPGVHGAIEWLLRQWRQQGELPKLRNYKPKGPPGGTPTWGVNGQGQTLTVIPGPVQSPMATPESQGKRTPAEKSHGQKILQSFAITTKEVTVEEFQRFLADNPNRAKGFAANLEKSESGEKLPILGVNWYTAAAYCNWLSQKEKLPESEWCYPPGRIGPGMVLDEGHLRRKGYRLPTEAEWEYACRAGATTRWPYGRSEALLEKYAWYQKNSGNRAQPVGRLRPNDLGLFDMLGNAAEWCHDGFADDTEPAQLALDGGSRKKKETARHAVRGGSFAGPASQARCGYRDGHPSSDHQAFIGFRVARTTD
jgi:formylglycine-generating enzyme required for sulfatase activity/tRNA A-37 threonylcarbamoyl transferase component Bud32